MLKQSIQVFDASVFISAAFPQLSKIIYKHQVTHNETEKFRKDREILHWKIFP